MSLRVKAGIDLEELKKYGFKTGKEWADAGERCLEGIGYEYQHEWYHKFLMDAYEPIFFVMFIINFFVRGGSSK